MFQTFEVTTTPETGPARLSALRDAMAKAGVDGFLVPRADRFQGEYVAPSDERLAWLTGFTGSAGFSCVLNDVAGVFVDGRYRVQVRDQVADVFTPVDWPETELADWLRAKLPQGGVIAFDPWLHTVSQIEHATKALDGTSIEMRANRNLVDTVWHDRPAPPKAPMRIQPEAATGESHAAKRQRLAADLKDAGDRIAFVGMPDSICWLLNIRGTDIPRNPVVHAFALLHPDDRVDLFSDATLDAEVKAHLGDRVGLHPLDGLTGHLKTLDGATVQIDPATTPQAVLTALETQAEITVVHGKDPCSLPKARKNAAEIAGARDAHLRDGAAMVRFLSWLDRMAPQGGLTEIDVVTALEAERRATNALLDISFETISGAGPNGAIVHYRVNEDTNRPVKPGELLLVDSGGQYADGTTDITRTMAIGPAGEDERTCYTRVLQGLVAISRARFPRGVRGSDLDALARYPLWLAGQDYDHGTGHGVGSYLCVHEGPQGLSRRSSVPLEPGMILSNEPGYYREGAFGIRIENLIVVQEAPTLPGGDTRDMLSFETLTYVPFDRRLIDPEMLSKEERAWIDTYHREVLSRIGPLVDGDAARWLSAACAPL